MKYKVGDKVVIVNGRTEIMDKKGKMDKWLGKIMTIDQIAGVYDPILKMKEDCGYWYWCENMIDHEATARLNNKNKTNHRQDSDILHCISIDKEIYSDKYTIVILLDGRKGVAKCHPDDEFNESRGFEVALAKALLKEVK